MRLLLSLLVALPLLGAEVRVFAAASLMDVLTEIARDYERGRPDRIVFNFGASSLLARQIEQGAPADLFLSADEAKMDALAKRGLIDARSRSSMLSNRLVLVVPRGGNVRLRHPRQLAEAGVASIALAEPSTVPAGIYARLYLQKLGIWERVAPKVIPTDNVRGALAAVASGNADAAIVYRTDLRNAKNVRAVYEVPRDEGPAISYPFALTARAEAREAAQRFLGHLRSARARAVFARHGFDVLR